MSGRGEPGGNDLIVTFGGWHVPRDGHDADEDGDGTPDNHVGTVMEQAGTLMHELGHNLGLGHGGGDNFNYKPNYQSVMNYWYQMDGVQRLFMARIIDYSHEELGTLNERSLLESAGVAQTDVDDVLFYFCSSPPFVDNDTRCPPDRERGSQWRLVTGGSGIDWDCELPIESEALMMPRDINGDLHCPLEGSNGYDMLVGHDDWQNIRLSFRDSPYGADGIHSNEVVEELDAETAEQLPSVKLVDVDVLPGQCPHVFNEPIVRVAVVGTETLDVATLVPETAVWGGALAGRWYMEDVSSPYGDGGEDLCKCTVRGGDGLLDLVLEFDRSEVVVGVQARLQVATMGGDLVVGEECVIMGERLRRGYVNTDDRFDISDGIAILGFLFLGAPESLGCADAADVNDNGGIELSDAVRCFNYLFLGGAELSPPFMECGVDETPDVLECAQFALCE